jgi:hypothetical protein
MPKQGFGLTLGSSQAGLLPTRLSQFPSVQASTFSVMEHTNMTTFDIWRVFVSDSIPFVQASTA